MLEKAKAVREEEEEEGTGEGEQEDEKEETEEVKEKDDEEEQENEKESQKREEELRAEQEGEAQRAALLLRFEQEKARLLQLQREHHEREQRKRAAEEDEARRQQRLAKELELAKKKTALALEREREEATAAATAAAMRAEAERARALTMKKEQEEIEKAKEKEREKERMRQVARARAAEQEEDGETEMETTEESSDEDSAAASGDGGRGATIVDGVVVDLEMDSVTERVFPVSVHSRCVLPLHLASSLIPSSAYARLPSLLCPPKLQLQHMTSSTERLVDDMLETLAPTDGKGASGKVSQPSVGSRYDATSGPAYESPLKCLRSWRLSRHYDKRLDSLTYSHKIDPWNHLCRFDLHGTCNDDECPWQHMRDIVPTEDETLEELAEYGEEVGAGSKHELVSEAKKRSGAAGAAGDSLSRLVDLINERRTDATHPNSVVLSAAREESHAHHASRKRGPKPAFSKPMRRRRGGGGSSAPASKKQRVEPKGRETEQAPDLSMIGRDFVPFPEHDDDDDDDSDKQRTSGDGDMEGGVPVRKLRPLGAPAVGPEDDRYYGERSMESLEQVIRTDKKNVAGWLNYAFEQYLRGRSGTEEERKAAKERALVVLARALEVNTTSEELWRAYLHFYLHQERVPSRSEIKDLFESAVGFLPHSYFLWRLYISHIDDVRGRALLCERALRKLAEASPPHPPLGDQERTARSRDLLDMILLLAHTYVQAGYPGSAVARLHLLLFNVAPPPAEQEDGTAGGPLFLPDGAPPMASALVLEHRCLVALAFVYLTAYRRLPCVPDTAMRFPHHLFLIDWRFVVKDASLTERLRVALLKTMDSFSAASPPPPTTAGSAAQAEMVVGKVRVVLQLNLLLMELHLGAQSVDTCRLMCQQYLRSAPTTAELWILYAWIEEVAGNHHDAELVLNKFVLRYPDQFAGWHAYALLALVRKGPAAALDVLAHSIGQFLPAKPGLGDAIPLTTARSLFHALLHLPAPEGEAPLHLTQSIVKEPERNVHLWQNYCMFESLRGSPASAKSAFELALSALPTPNDRLPIWHQYVALRKGLEGAAGVQKVVDLLSRCYSDISPHLSASTAPLPPGLQAVHPHAKKVIRDSIPLPFVCHNLLLESALAGLHRSKWGPVQRAVLQITPANTRLSFLAARFELRRSNTSAAKALLDAALRHNPACDATWLNAARMRLREGDAAGASHLFLQAIQTHPTSALLWANWIAVGKGRGLTEEAAAERSEAERRGVRVAAMPSMGDSIVSSC